MKPKKIHSTLMWNYTFFIILISLILTAALTYLFSEIDSRMKEGVSPVYRAKDLVNESYRDISIEDIKPSGGWVEILNEQKKVIHVIGVKKDDLYTYNERELYEKLDNPESQEFYYSIAPFTTPRGRELLCLVKIPRDSITIQVHLFKNYEQTVSEVTTTILKAIPILLIPIALMIFLFSHWTAKRISRPLKTITEGLKKMRDGEYDTRLVLDVKAESGFAKIRDAFNYMADRLEKTEQENQKLEESKQRMLVDISHDLKTPITSIQGYARALNEGMVNDKDKTQRYLNLIYDKSVRVTSLINTLFEFLMMDDSDYHLSTQEADLCEFLREMVLGHFDEMEEKNFDLHVHLPQTEVLYPIDQKQLSRAVSNILSNAVKYNPEGTKLRIELMETDDSVQIEIGDDGVGIPENVRQNIFDPFTRGDTARKSDGGTGLGLSISKKIVEKHGGSLCLLESSVERTIFAIHLPKGGEMLVAS